MIMFKYKGRSLNINDELLAEFEENTYGELDEATANVYIRNRYGFDPADDPDRLSELSDEEIEAAIADGMKTDIEAFLE